MHDYKTPWSPYDWGHQIKDNTGVIRCEAWDETSQLRVIDCVNACEGMEDPAEGMLQAVEEMHRLSKRHEDLAQLARDLEVDLRKVNELSTSRENKILEAEAEIRRLKGPDLTLVDRGVLNRVVTRMGELEARVLRLEAAAEGVNGDYLNGLEQAEYEQIRRSFAEVAPLTEEECPVCLGQPICHPDSGDECDGMGRVRGPSED